MPALTDQRGDPSAARSLKASLGDPEPRTRLSALMFLAVLARVGTADRKDVGEALTGLLGGSDREVRSMSGISLRQPEADR